MLSAALDSGLAISTIFIFFVLNFPKNGTIGLNTVQTWWGNTVFTNTVDWNATPLRTMPDGLPFGYVPSTQFFYLYAHRSTPQPHDLVLILVMVGMYVYTIARWHSAVECICTRVFFRALYSSKHNRLLASIPRYTSTSGPGAT